MSPLQPPLPTSWNLPFQLDMGSQVSVLMSESCEGVRVNATRQNAGRSANSAAAPAGGLNCPAGTTCAEVTDAFGRVSDIRRIQAAESAERCAEGPWASTVPPAPPK